MSETKRIIYSIVKFLRSQLNAGELSTEGLEGVEVAIQCLESAYDININDTHLDLLRPLKDLLTPQDGGVDKMPEISAADKAEAERLKNEGNNFMSSQNFQEAIICYTKAIELDPNNAVYYCNRAAAASKLNNHESAIQDCKAALTIDPSYSKSYGRLGLAYSNLNRHQEAYESYKKAVQLEPDNESYRNNLQLTEEKLQSMNRPIGIPGLDFSSILANPALLSMASQMLSNPSMQNMMGNILSGNMNRSGADTGMDALLQAGQQLAAQMESENPGLVDQLRRQLGESNQPQPQPDSKKDD